MVSSARNDIRSAGEFLAQGFADLYAGEDLCVPPDGRAARARRLGKLTVGGDVLLNVRQHLADYQCLLQTQRADSNIALQVEALILQVDEYHRSSTCDALAFTGISKDGKAAKTTFSCKAIVTAVQSCTLLRDSADLERQMRCAVRLLLPDQADDLTRAIDQGLARAPSAASLSRWRLAVDVGFMFLMRSLVAQNRRHAVRCLLADSSPQRGFDWFLTEWHTLSPASFSSWVRRFWMLTQNRIRGQMLSKAMDSSAQGHDEDDLQNQLTMLEVERKQLEDLLHASQPPVDVHISLPTAQGSKHAGLVHKAHALLHTLYLEVGGWPQVADFLSSVRAITTDFGTEIGLADMCNIDLTALFPWAATAAAPDFDKPQEAADAFLIDPEAHEEPQPLPDNTLLETRQMDNGESHLILPRLFPLALQVPGALHVLHHAVEEITSAFEAYENWFFPALKAVVGVMSKKYIRERFVSNVLRGNEEAKGLEHAVLQLQLNLHESRWGTLVNTCKELLRVRVVFTLWNSEKIFGGEPAPNAKPGDREIFVQAAAMTQAISDASWWSYITMILRLARAIDLLEHWCEACPCHYRKFNEDVPLSGNAIFRTRYSCPMSGRRSPELATGAVQDLLKDVFSDQQLYLMMSCAHLPQQDRDKILMDFNRGQVKLEHFMLLKFSFWTALPHKLCALGHSSEALARQTLLDAQEFFNEHADSNQHHPLTLHFFRGPLAVPLQEFLSGQKKREDSVELMQEAAALAFVPCVERSIEARHALLKAKTAVMKRVRPATFSLALRSHEFHRRCLLNKSLLLEWENHVHRLKSVPKFGLPVLVHHVGFALHPNIVRILQQGGRLRLRDVAFMLYRCDIESMYDKRTEAARTITQPHFRDNPQLASRMQRLVHSQQSDEDKQSVMLRILMMEHFKQRCQEGELYSVQGLLPETRYLQDSLVPPSRNRKVTALARQQAQGAPSPQGQSFEGMFAVPDAPDPFMDSGTESLPVTASALDEKPRLFLQVR